MSLAHGNRPIVTDGLVLCLDAANSRSYSGTGTDWFDLSGNGNDATLVNGVGYSADNLGYLSFDGVDDYTESAEITPTYFTLSCWYKATGVPARNDDFGGVLVASSEQLPVQYFLSHSWINQNVRLIVQSNSARIETGLNTILNNITHNIAATYDGVNRKIYHNGVLVAESSWSTDPVYPTSGNVNVKIGKWGYTSTYERNFNGNIYNASIYNRALTAEEVQQNFNAMRGRYGI